MPPARRFPPPWSVEELKESFVVEDATGQALGHFYFDDEPRSRPAGKLANDRRIDVPRYSANTIGDMRKLLFSYRDNMRVEIETGVPVTAETVADLRALTTWPDGLVLSIHTDLDPRFSIVKVQRAS